VTSNKTKKLLTTYLRRLTNLSGNNRSIFLPRLNSEQFLDLHELTFLNAKNSFSIIQNLIAGKTQSVAAELDSRMEANNLVSKKLKKLKRLDEFLFDERGTKDLHVGWPFVHGRFMDGTLVRCPLLYFPVELVLEKGQWILKPRVNAEITYNKSFLLAYSFYNQTLPATDALEEDFQEADTDSSVFRTFIYQSLQRNNLEINFNPDNYRDELTTFRAYKKDEFESTTETGRLKLFPEAVLGIFPQAGSSLVPDYLQLIDDPHFTDLEEIFARKNESTSNQQTNFLREVREEKVYAVFPMDAWQENALKGVKLGNSLVVQGPPGTGKSQLISNLISDMIANHKRVLLVCQKRVALDVVYNRLKEKRLDEFIGLVHDFKEDRRELYEKVSRQIDRLDEYKSKNNSLDAIQMERKFYEVSRRIDHLTEELENFKTYLFDESECGISAKQLYLLSKPTEPAVEVKQELTHFKWQAAVSFQKKLKQYAGLAERFLAESHAWRVRKSFAGYSVSDLVQIRQSLQEVRPWFATLNEELKKLVSTTLEWSQCEAYLEKKTSMTEMLALLEDATVYSNFQRMASEADEDTSLLWLGNMEKMVVECFDEEGPELTIASPQLGQFQLALYRSMKARRSIFGMVRWELFSTDKFLIKRTLVANQLSNSKDGFKELERKLDRRLNLEHNLSKLRAVAWLPEVPTFVNALEVKRWFASVQFATQAKLLFGALRGIQNLINPIHHSHLSFTGTITKFFGLLSQLPPQQEKWSNWLLPSQIREIIANEQHAQTLSQVLQSDFDALCDFDALHESLEPHERLVIQRLFDKTSSWNDTLMESVFTNSVCLAWIDHIEMKHPELRIVSSGKMELIENELRDLLGEKEAISSEILLMRAREGVVEELQFNRLNNRVTYRDLNHQLVKKKKIWPIRKVIAEFEDDLFRLVPCWMASPESVSSIFPMTELFDLVIFDEASQCFAERGVPALYRGKQCMIAGDPQQLQPSDLYLARWEDDSEEPEAELTSLLELGNRFLQRVMLQGHYRSRSPELIAFSNQHFYENKLHLLPDCSALNQPEPAIVYERVDGTWENNCNLAEAIHVKDLVVRLSTTASDKEVGIITFNAPQQSLIQDLLDQEERENKWIRPSSLFIKNIENVQGDERDIIIFSVGYAADKNGRVSAQFGSLNQSGGENRLNVAVTRAREKIYVVASIESTDLQVEDTRNAGPKLLQRYLQQARLISTGAYIDSPGHPVPHGPAWYLKSKLRQELVTRYGVEEKFTFADFIFRKDSQYFGIIQTDDDYYFESPSAKSSHGLLPRLLQDKRWKHKMIYSRNWWMDPDKFWNEIGKFNS
jgi:hypothetical protein